MKIDRWISYGEAEGLPEAPMCDWGGWFAEGHRWDDYLAALPDGTSEHAEALRADVVAKRLRLTGEQHQYGDGGVPVFSDGTAGVFTYRAWGDLMAAIWSTEDGRDYHYMDFYM